MHRKTTHVPLRALPEAAARTLRDRLEEKTVLYTVKTGKSLSPGKTRRVLHELKVHQIELKMQNEELRRAQVELEASRARYFDLYDLAPVGYFTISEKGLILEANLTATQLLGTDSFTLVNKPASRIILHEDQGIYYTHSKRLFNTGVPQGCELRLAKKDGAVLWVRLDATIVQDAQGTPVCRAVMSDITARKQAEEKSAHDQAMLQAERRKVEEAHARLAAIVENSYDAILSTTLDGAIESWNGSAERMYEYTEEEIKGQPVAMLAPPDRSGEMPGIILKIKAGESIRDFETVRRNKSGAEIAVSLTVSPVKTTKGEIIGASIICRDISDRKEWERSIMDLNERLQVSNRELENLGNTLSHDLRGPIQCIEGYCSLLLDQHAERLGAESERFLKIINKNAQYMRDMITGLLDISRIARAEIRREIIDMTELAGSIIQDYRNAEPGRDAEVFIQEDLIAEGDGNLLRIALDNLIRNAWKFTRKRPKALVEFGKTENGGKTAFFLRDNGAGFDMKYADKLFAVFQRLHSDAEFEGTGVGLATVQRIIHRHDGEIWAEGKVDEGAIIHFTLP
ncbi:MAG: PAS domain S-box protein [Chitinispirillaceae bacterium]|nr:PAS domain S-box protein [Chitinispirillaceae bacterium]